MATFASKIIINITIFSCLISLIHARSFIGFNGKGFNAFHKSTQKNINTPISTTNIPTANTNTPTSDPIVIIQDQIKPSKRPKIYPTYRPTSNKQKPSPTKQAIINSKYSYTPFQTDTIHETNVPTSTPTDFIPEDHTTIYPTETPSANPTNNPTHSPTMRKSVKKPTIFSKYKHKWKFKHVTDSTKKPSFTPINNPSNEPTSDPSSNPSSYPTEIPTVSPTQDPTMTPTNMPTYTPTDRPTRAPIRDICPEEFRQGQSFDYVIIYDNSCKMKYYECDVFLDGIGEIVSRIKNNNPID
eukprot:535631_1